MKQVKLKFPTSQADAFATFTFSNSIRILLSWSVDEFFDAKITAIVAIEEANIELLTKSDVWAKFIQK